MSAVLMDERDESIGMPAATTPTHQRQMQPATPADLVRFAMDQGVDIDRLERLYALQQRWEQEQAKKAYVAAMVAFKSEHMEILKRKRVGYETKEGEFVGYSHAELADVTEVVVPAMARHGLSHDWNIRQENARVFVDCIITHELGHSKTVTMDAAPDASGKKNAVQQIASAITYLQRYTLLASTGMATKGMDDDGRASGDAAQSNPRERKRQAEPEDTEERRKLVADLYAKADEGLEALERAWNEIGKEGRKMVGNAEWLAIKSKAEGAGQ